MGVIPRSDGKWGRAAWGSPALVLSLLAVALPAVAGKPDKEKIRFTELSESRRESPGRCPGVSLDQAIEAIERRNKARVVKANVVQQNDRCVYELRLLSDEGRVWTVRVDSRTGG